MQRTWLLLLLTSSLYATPHVRLPVRIEAAEGGGFAVRTGKGDYSVTASGDLRLSSRLEMRLAGRDPGGGASLSKRLPGFTNDLRGNDPARWRSGVPQYGRVRFARVYPGIDLVFHGGQSELEYDFEVAPGAAPDRIVLEFEGAESVRLGSSGELMVHAPGEDFRFLRPGVSQEGRRIRGRYRLLGGNRVGFRVGRYDRRRALLIDPVLGYAARFGSQGGDPIQALAVDAAGNVYIAGTTTGTVPVLNALNPKPSATNCSLEPGRTFMQCEAVFVAKFDATGAKLLYSTYLGGDTRNYAAGIAVDRDGNVYVAGTTRAVDRTTPRAWVMKLNPNGSAILYNRSIAGDTAASAVAVDTQGNAYLAGTSLALDFPAVNALQAQAPVKSLLATRDGGVTWRALNNNLMALTVYSLATDPGGAKLYAATVSGLFRSLDGGANWTQLFPAAQVARQVILDPSNPATLYVLYGDSNTGINQIAKSMDGGNTWQVLTGAVPPKFLFAPPHQFGAMALDPSNSSVVWLTDTSPGTPAIYRSGDGGGHWTDVHDFPAFFLNQGDALSPDPDVAGIRVDPKNSSRVYVCCAYQIGSSASAVFRTDDGGKTWIEGGHGPTAGTSGIWPPVLDPRDGGVLYAPWYGGVVRSGDAGQTWTPVALPSGAPAAGYNPGSLAVDSSGALYLINDSGALFRRAADGTTWIAKQGPWMPGARILALDPVSPSSTIYVGSPGTSVAHAFAVKLDPAGSVLWATLLAGSQQDEAHAMAVDSAGNAYVAGRTNSLDFPLANPVQVARGKAPPGGPGFDAFLSKISTDGRKLVYSTYLGGTSDDGANAVAVDSAGAAHIAGSTTWDDFPTVNAIQAVPGSKSGGSFVAKFDATGQKLLYSTYLSGATGWPFNDAATSIAVDAQGSAWVAGQTGAIGFPLVQPIQSSLPPGVAAYIAKLVPSGTGAALGFATYLGGNFDSIAALAIGPTGSIWVAGTASSLDFIGSTDFGSSGFLARLDLEPLAPATPGIPLVRAVYNAASMRLGDVVSPGQIASIFGAELAPAAGSATGFPLPQSLQGVTVAVGGVAAPLFYVSPGQINFQVPFEVAQGATSIVVKRGSGSPLVSAVERSVIVIPATPGIFTASGDGYNSPVVVHNSDYTQVTPQNPARAGEYLAIFCTGLGAVDAGVRAGDAAPAATIQQPLDVVVDAVASVSYVGLAPGFAGLYQVNFQVNAGVTPGAKLLYISIRGVASNQVPLYVK